MSGQGRNKDEVTDSLLHNVDVERRLLPRVDLSEVFLDLDIVPQHGEEVFSYDLSVLAFRHEPDGTSRLLALLVTRCFNHDILAQRGTHFAMCWSECAFMTNIAHQILSAHLFWQTRHQVTRWGRCGFIAESIFVMSRTSSLAGVLV
ncbi:hypothetical protein HG530_012223 [Fusarium avenaceum]|nr:hypothetical protein HG530_012223 [Fusarium avenaceum]